MGERKRAIRAFQAAMAGDDAALREIGNTMTRQERVAVERASRTLGVVLEEFCRGCERGIERGDAIRVTSYKRSYSGPWHQRCWRERAPVSPVEQTP